MPREQLVAFSWSGLPQYAARLLHSAVARIGRTCVVVGSRPRVPIEGMEEVLGQEIVWVDPSKPCSWAQLGVPVPQVFFQSGWAQAAFVSLGAEVQKSGGSLILLMDNAWRGTPRQYAGAAWFRARQLRRYAAVMVPGHAAASFARRLGFPSERIFTGMYGADPSLFYDGEPLGVRPRRIVFVGQYIQRKGCVHLAESFAAVSSLLPGWELHMYGSGPLMQRIPQHPRIVVSPFVQPECLSLIYRQARVLALPSAEESWGLVVHEAALSGCLLLLSDAVGARMEFARSQNSSVFRHGRPQELSNSILHLGRMEHVELEEGHRTSLRLAESCGPAVFADQTARILMLVQADRDAG